MKGFRSKVAVLAAAALTMTGGLTALAQATPPANRSSSPMLLAQGATFGLEETDQDPFVLIAQPTSRLGGVQRYGLMILEQKQPEPLCWSESGSNPTQIEPLLLNFDFSGICGKATDTNGYLIRVNGEDVRYDPVLEEENGRLVLYGNPRRSLSGQVPGPRIVIGQTDGIAPNGFTKIFLNPSWRLARQTFNDRPTGRTYVASDLTLAQLAVDGEIPTPRPTPTPTPTPMPTITFSDTRGDIYAQQIEQAVQIGFIAGFQDGTFRPRTPLTREQLVSMVIEALDSDENISVALPNQVTNAPFRDVPRDRWSAAKIAFASQNDIVAGYQDGAFRPTQTVTRAEMMAVLRRAAQYRRRVQGQSVDLPATQSLFNFSDIGGHWAAPVIQRMSVYCGIATPVNESGTAFMPNEPALRNYAATAVVRLVDCSTP
ncbi:MAG: DUF3747 domain-containing protein [Leptolyngbya sp. SIO4C1]|nr:DUF3747 domain-containing protein [Leptolyngbya sp. SIO4C1]